MRGVLFFLLCSLGFGSGTFIYPPPPVSTVTVESSQIEKGGELFTRVGPNGKSCADCHSKSGERPFRRRNLARVINRLLPQLNRCFTDSKRMDLSGKHSQTSPEFLQFRAFLASKYRLTRYLN